MQLDSHRYKMCFAFRFDERYHDTEEQFHKQVRPLCDPPEAKTESACSSPSTVSETSLRTPNPSSPVDRTPIPSPKLDRKPDPSLSTSTDQDEPLHC